MIDLKEIIHKNFDFLSDKTILLAVSGGVDSMVLMDLFGQSPFNSIVAHCNFQLRGKESDSDQEFVLNKAQQYGLDCQTIRFDTKAEQIKRKKSTQIIARELRYAWFEQLSKELNIDYILTAHHKDDNLETVLINFIRGTGLEGLTGIPPKNGRIIRPLLNFSKQELISYASKSQITWVEDASNLSEDYLRNKIRHRIIPLIKPLNSAFLKSFTKTIQHLRNSNDALTEYTDILLKSIIKQHHQPLKFESLDINKLNQFKNQEQLLYRWLSPFKFSSWNDIYQLKNTQSGKYINSKDYVLEHHQNKRIPRH